MISLYIANVITLLTFLTYGKTINSVLFPDTKKDEINFYDIISGIIYLSFIAIFINFFFPLNKYINNIILISSLLLLIFIILSSKKLKNLFFLSLSISLISLLIMTLDHSNRPDAGLYHLPYISILNENKIIFGISNIHFRYAHTSIVQHTSAIFNNSLFSDKGVTVPISIILSTLIFYFFKKFNQKPINNFFLVFYFLMIAFILMKISRYNDIGNDSIGHIFYFLVTSYFLWSFYNLKFEYKHFFFLVLFSIFAFANKIFLVFLFIFPLYLLFYKKNYKYFLDKRSFFLLALFIIFFVKNIIISSCLVYPLKVTCFKEASWSAVNKNSHASPERKSIEGQAAAKAWTNFKEKNLSYSEYNDNFNWLKTWGETHLKYILKKLTPLFILIFLISLIFFFKEKITKVRKDKTSIFSKKPIILTLIVSSFGSMYWFLSFPIYRYGYSLFVSGIIILVSYFFHYYFSKKNILNIFNLLKKILLIILIFFVMKNLTRIYDNFFLRYHDYPWPKIYAYDNKNIKQENNKLYTNRNINIYYPKYRLCMYSKSPCTHYQNIKNKINITKSSGYIIISPK